MKNYFLPIIALFFVIFISCGKKQTKEVIVYGSSKCHHCTDFMKQLDSAEISYEFRDLIIEEKEYDKEMIDRVEKTGYKGYISLPVIAIEEEVYIKPHISEIAVVVKE